MDTEIWHDETLNICCGKRAQIKVLLIGGTQNGKSSLVKSILSYGGYNDLSSEIKKGNNNVSQTQVVSAYARKIEFKSNQLKNKQGKPLNFPQNSLQQLQTKDIEHHSMPSGSHIHLKLLDTPGLGDSNNYKAAAATFKHKSIAELSAIKVVDEQHKLEIMERLLGEEHIHAICFVIKWGEPFSDSLQKDIKSYREIFEESDLKSIKYFVLHTKVLPSVRSAETLKLRERKFRQVFDLQATHFFLDSGPDPDIPLEVYLSQSEISKLLAALALTPPCPIPDLKYTKSSPQQSLDDELRDLLGQEVLSKVVDTELEHAKIKLEELSSQMKRKEKEILRARERRVEKEKKIEDYDKLETVEINQPFTLCDNGSWFASTRIVFDVPTSTTIRDWELEPSEEQWEKKTGKGTCQFHGILTGGWNSTVSGTVKLKGYKSEKYAIELGQEREDLQTCLDTIVILINNSKSIESEKRLMEAAANDLQLLRQGLRENVSRISSRTVSLKNAKKNCLYLTICNPIGMSLAYDLSQKIPKKYLPPNRTPQSTSLYSLRNQRNRWDSILASVGTVLGAFLSDLARKKPVLEALKNFQKEVETARSWVNGKLATKPRLETGILAMVYKPYLEQYPRIKENLEQLEQDLTSCAERLDGRLEELREMEHDYLSHLVEDIEISIEELRSLIRKNAAERKEWTTYEQICKTTLAAIDETIQLCLSETLTPGPFYIVYKVLISAKTKNIDPFSVLFDEMLVAYHLRDSGEIMQLQREMDKAAE